MASRRRTRPTKITLRAYDVGFGDCFLLSFHYAAGAKHVLIDFGSTRMPPGKRGGTGSFLERIASQIATDCEGQLTAVVATHRHKDHIAGFTRKGAKGPGEIIRRLKPAVVLQPWTEDPKAAPDAVKPTRLKGLRGRQALYVGSLRDMNRYAGFVRETAKRLRGGHLEAVREQLGFLGDDNDLGNRDAIVNLMNMGQRPARYLFAGARSGLETLLPGVKVHVLGPPTLAQEPRIATQTATQADEYWHLRAGFWARRGQLAKAAQATAPPLFPRHTQRHVPWDARWYRFHAQREHAESLLSIVRTLDDAMNNTSLILLFEIGRTLLLFPGDAQWENWRYALSQPKYRKLLERVTLYKVGHHGSLNATPKSLWRSFTHRGNAQRPDRLFSVLSTMDHVHGSAERGTEVPRARLVEALTKDSNLLDTRRTPANELRAMHEITLC